MATFTAVWKDSGLLSSLPPFLVVPCWEGIGLVYLNSVRSLNVQHDLKFDRTNLKVTEVKARDVPKHLLRYTHNFPSKVFADVLALTPGILNTMRFGSVLLCIEGKVSGRTTSLDYIGKASRARMDVYSASRRTVDVSFRFVRYQNAAGQITAGTTHAPSHAAELIDVLNRLYMPSANIELRLKSSAFADVHRHLGPPILMENFRNHIIPLRDADADVTVFFVGAFKGTTDPLGASFRGLDCVVVDDAPLDHIAPPTAWPPSPALSDEDIPGVGRPLDRTRSDRDLHVVLAHEIGHWLGAGHNDLHDDLMSKERGALKLGRETLMAVRGR